MSMAFFATAYLLVSVLSSPTGPLIGDVNRPQLVRITASAETCRVGGKLKLIELAPTSLEAISGIRHRVYRIARYDRDTLSIAILDEPKLTPVTFNKTFTGLPQALLMSHGANPMPVDGGFGFTFDVTPEVPGIYLVTCVWTPTAKKTDITCSPIVITVLPQHDKDGQPILKPEWFRSVVEIK